MGFFDFFSPSIETEVVDLLSPEERAAKSAASKWLTSNIGQGAGAYAGQLVADIPNLFSQAYDWYGKQFGREDINTAMSEMIAGKPAYTHDPAATAERWQGMYATPVMEAWRETVLPTIKESFNVPGGAYSTAGARGTLREAGNFYGQYVSPQLFQAQMAGERMGFESGEAAAARRPGALALPAQRFGEAATAAGMMRSMEQQELDALYREFIRTRAEPGWAAQMAQGITPSMEAYAMAKPSGFSQALSVAGQGLGLALGGTKLYDWATGY